MEELKPPTDRVSLLLPRWLRQFGYASWLLIGIVIVVVGICAALSAVQSVVVPTLFAVLLAATFLPLVDLLQRWHIKRWIGALVVTLIIIVGVSALVLVVVKGLVEQAPAIGAQVNSALHSIQATLVSHDIKPEIVDSLRDAVKKGASSVTRGVAGGVVSGVQSMASLLFGAFIALNILVYLLIDGRGIGLWFSRVMHPLPQPTAYAIIADGARFLRSYLWGSTLVGVFNGVLVGVGTLIINVPLAFTIGVICWVTNYIPMFGVFIGGAFAVLIALGVGGIKKALFMLLFIVIANGPLQNVVTQFALGGALKLHGLVVLLSTTLGAVLAGAIGGVFAAPFTKIAIDAYVRLKGVGMFDTDDEGGEGAGALPAEGPEGGPP